VGQSPLDSLSRHHGRIRGSRTPLPQAWRDAAKQKPWRGYDALLDRGSKDAPTSYPLQRPDQQKFASEATRAFVEFVSTWTDNQTFDRGEDSSQGRSPRPKPALRMMPLGSNDPRAERPD
jgi:hypothetical protein